MSGRFGSTGGANSNNAPLELTPGDDLPEPAAPGMVLGGTGTDSYTDAADPSQDQACTFTLTAPDPKPGLELLWHGARKLVVDLDLGGPGFVSNAENCGGTPSDPTGSEPWIETLIPVKNPAIGRSFTVPVTLDHTLTSGDSTGSDDQDLSLNGALEFVLVRVDPPYLN